MNTAWGRVLRCGTGVALIGFATGCGGSPIPTSLTAISASQSPVTSATSASQPSTVSQAGASSSHNPVASASSTRATTTSTPAPVPTCTAADLAITDAKTDIFSNANSGGLDTQIFLRNTSGSPCRLGGWPGLQFLGQFVTFPCQTGTPECGTPDTTSLNPVTVTDSHHGTPAEITLTPGADTYFAVLWTPAYDTGTSATPTCDYNPTVAPYSIQIRVPRDSTPLTWVIKINGNSGMVLCTSADVQVTAFGVSA